MPSSAEKRTWDGEYNTARPQPRVLRFSLIELRIDLVGRSPSVPEPRDLRRSRKTESFLTSRTLVTTGRQTVSPAPLLVLLSWRDTREAAGLACGADDDQNVGPRHSGLTVASSRSALSSARDSS